MHLGTTDPEFAPYQNFWRRYWAATLDGGILSMLYLMISARTLGTAPIVSILLPLLPYLYSIGFHAWRGQTPGKLVAGIRVTRPDGNRIHLREAVLRDAVPLLLTVAGLLFLAASAMRTSGPGSVDVGILGYQAVGWISFGWFVLELLTMLMNPRRRALHDFVAGTVVVRLAGMRRGVEAVTDSTTVTEHAAPAATKAKLRAKPALILAIVLIGGVGFLVSSSLLLLVFVSGAASGGAFRMKGITHKSTVDHRWTLEDGMFSSDSSYLAVALHEVRFHPANESFPAFWARIPEWFLEGSYHVRIYERANLEDPIWELREPARQYESVELLTWDSTGVLMLAHKSLKEGRYRIWSPGAAGSDSVARDSVPRETWLASRRRHQDDRPWRLDISGDELFLWNVETDEKHLLYQMFDDPSPVVVQERESELWRDSFHRFTEMSVEDVADTILIRALSRPLRVGDRPRAYEWTMELAVPDVEAEKRREFGTLKVPFRVFVDSLPAGPGETVFRIPVDTVLAILAGYPPHRVVTINPDRQWGVGTTFYLELRAILGEESGVPFSFSAPPAGGLIWKGCFIPLHGSRWRPEWRAFAEDTRRRGGVGLPPE